MDAAASTSPPDIAFAGRTADRDPPVKLLQLAQSDEIEIYIDEDGRRVFVDPFDTGGLGVDPADIPYRPRPYRDGQPVDEYPVAPDATFPERPTGRRIPGGTAAPRRDGRADRAAAAR